jgi:hypothetical protein
MAARSWAGSSITAVAVAAGAGAAQLGVGYGLGIVAWLPADAADGRVPWLASLAWVVWIAASSTGLGAVIAHSLAGRGGPDGPDGFLLGAWRATLVLSAGLGALIVVPLVAVPARAAETPQNFAPEWTAAGYAVVGLVAGLIVAVAALTARAVAANLVASVGYLWVLAVVAVIDSLRQGDERVLAQLAIWEFNGGPQVRGYYVPGVLLMLLAAAAIGFAAAWRAGRRGDSRVGVAMSGATGPLLVAAAYLLAAPAFAGEDNIDVSQWSAAMFAPYAVLAGLAGSVLVAAIGPPLTEAEKAERAARAVQRRAENADRAAQRSAEREAAREEKRRAAEEAKRRAEEAKQTPSAGEPQHLPVAQQRSDDDLADWPSTLDREPSTVSTAKGTAPVRDPDDGLDEDAYAPARAYRSGGSTPTEARAYASDTVEPEETPPGERPATGRADPKTPLWPTKNEGEDPKPPRPRRR